MKSEIDKIKSLEREVRALNVTMKKLAKVYEKLLNLTEENRVAINNLNSRRNRT